MQNYLFSVTPPLPICQEMQPEKWGMKNDIEHKKPRPVHEELGEGYGILEQDYSPKCSVLF